MRQEAVRAVDGLADGRGDGRGTEEAVCRAVGPVDGQRTARRTGGQTSTGRNGHLQHREYKTPPSAGRSSFYPRVKLTKS